MLFSVVGFVAWDPFSNHFTMGIPDIHSEDNCFNIAYSDTSFLM